MVVYYHVPTSNHNSARCVICANVLYIIMFLHQTTTIFFMINGNFLLYIIMFLHQTTTAISAGSSLLGCILSCSYIKPQRLRFLKRLKTVVYYHVPTSNHNFLKLRIITEALYIIMFLHQTTTYSRFFQKKNCCILSCSYIKPQQLSHLPCKESRCILSCSYIKPQLG